MKCSKCGIEMSFENTTGRGFVIGLCEPCEWKRPADLPPAERADSERSVQPQLYEGWRDAAKESPKDEGTYICVFRWYDNDLGQRLYRLEYFNGKHWQLGEYYDQKFLAWMPLPGPPAFV